MKKRNISKTTAIAMAAAVTAFAGKGLAEEKAGKMSAEAGSKPVTTEDVKKKKAEPKEKPKSGVSAEAKVEANLGEEDVPYIDVSEDAFWARESEERFDLGFIHPLGGQDGKRVMYGAGDLGQYTFTWSNEAVKTFEMSAEWKLELDRSTEAYNAFRKGRGTDKGVVSFSAGPLSFGLQLDYSHLGVYGEVEESSGAKSATSGSGELLTLTPSATFVADLGTPTEFVAFVQVAMERFTLDSTFEYPSREKVEFNEGGKWTPFFNGGGLEMRFPGFALREGTRISRIGVANLGTRADNLLGYGTVRFTFPSTQNNFAGLEVTPYGMHLSDQWQAGMEVAMPMAFVNDGRLGVVPGVRGTYNFAEEAVTTEAKLGLSVQPNHWLGVSFEGGRVDKFHFGDYQEDVPHAFVSGVRLTIKN